MTTGTLAKRPAKMHVPVGNIGRYSKETLSRYEIVLSTADLKVRPPKEKAASLKAAAT
jgi:hypothetical protein